MIDRMMVYKSGAAEFPGEFAGGIVDINTKSVVEENSLSVNITTGFRAGIMGKDFYKAEGSSTDWLGYDNGFKTTAFYVPLRKSKRILTIGKPRRYAKVSFC